MRNVAFRRIDLELDVIHFIKSQFEMKELIRSMTTKYQRAMSRSSKKFMLGDKNETDTTSESELDIKNEIAEKEMYI